MGKFDAKERQAQGRPVPEEIRRTLSSLMASSTASGEIVDIYEAAGLPKVSLSELHEVAGTVESSDNPHLAIEVLRDALTEKSRKATRGNLVRGRVFSDRIAELMRCYTNRQLTSAEVSCRTRRDGHRRLHRG